MAGMSICNDSLDLNILYEPGGLYLKPIIHLEILVMFPSFKTPGTTISNWEIMEKLKESIAPIKFISLKVSKTLIGGQVVETHFKKFNMVINNESINPNQYEFLLLEAELDNSKQASTIVDILNGKHNFLMKDSSIIGNKSSRQRYSIIKLSGIISSLKVRASYKEPLTKMQSKCHNIHTLRERWLTYFGSEKKFCELKPGHRPDTVVLQELPCKWFSDTSLDNSIQTNIYLPSEQLVYKVFSRYGSIRALHIPMLDQLSYENNVNSFVNKNFASTSNLYTNNPLTFEVYIQYMDYDGFERAMTALISSKLMFNPFKDSTIANNYYTTYFKCDFDRNKHMSQSNVKRRVKLMNELKAQPQSIITTNEVYAVAESSQLSHLKPQEIDPKIENIKNITQTISCDEQNFTQKPSHDGSPNLSDRLKGEEESRKRIKKMEKYQALARQKVMMGERKLILTHRKLESNRMLKYLFRTIAEKEETRLKEEAIIKAREERAERKAKKVKRKESKLQKKLILEEHRLRQKLLRKMRNKMKEKLQSLA